MKQAEWGIADLHAHPATHLAFGGMFWGEPGLVHYEDPDEALKQLEKDLPSCDAVAHSRGGNADPAIRIRRYAVEGRTRVGWAR